MCYCNNIGIQREYRSKQFINMSTCDLEGPVDDKDRKDQFYNKICGATHFPEFG